MPQTKLQICNAALIKIGGRTITSLTQLVKEAELCTHRFDALRDALLRGHTWAFSKEAVTLASAGDSTINPWLYYVELPDDLARIVAVGTDAFSERHHEQFGNLLHVYDAPVALRYVKRITDPYPDPDSEEEVPPMLNYSYPDDFAEALACYLAGELCVSLQDDEGMRASLLQQFSDSLRIARFNGAVERGTDQLTADLWNASRFIASFHDRSVLPLDAP